MINYFLKASLERNRIIRIMYLKDNEITERNIKVLDISDSNIRAFCYLRSKIRVFKLENILSASFKVSNYGEMVK
ncbi:hypothetical protein EHE19_019110 [Ruminiclostridium herbifermentans]|uniref:WYL domain-containing protein n=1 Tax=Ruminiclostridium herbifermentans TaxID=2488810 RepID=A0A4U7J9E7_9FIRM|nr:hypothetical protein [Ruminiclostridium herbifermentans]QNU66907.1 hypothetical protein EHE19_019110 [Ruminiclostridium herbifermentans]